MSLNRKMAFHPKVPKMDFAGEIQPHKGFDLAWEIILKGGIMFFIDI